MQNLKCRLIYFVFSPVVAFGAVHAVAMLSYLLAPRYEYFTHAPKYFSAVGVYIYIVFVGSFLAGALLAKSRRQTVYNEEEIRDKEKLGLFLQRMRFVILLSFFIMVAAYCVWFGRALASEGLSLFWLPFKSDAICCKEILTQYMVKGLTTLTQLGPFILITATVCLYMSRRRYYYVILLVVFVLSLIRVVYFAERLAFMELLVPFLVLRIRLYLSSLRIKRWLMAGVILFLAVWSTELIRSHPRYMQYSSMEYLCYKLFAYFSSGMNNFLAYVDFSNAFLPKDFLPHLLEGVYNFANISTHARKTIVYILSNVLTPEYTTFNGMGYIYMDFGLGGIPVLFILGFISYLLFSQFKKGTPLGLFTYPIIYLTIMDSFRIIYLSLPRGLLSFIVILLVLMLYYFCGGVRGEKWKFL